MVDPKYVFTSLLNMIKDIIIITNTILNENVSIIRCISADFCLPDNLIRLTRTMLRIQIAKVSTLAGIVDYIGKVYRISNQASRIQKVISDL